MRTAEQLAQVLRGAAVNQGPGCTIVIRHQDALAASDALREMASLLDRIANSVERPGHVSYISKGDMVCLAAALLERHFDGEGVVQ